MALLLALMASFGMNVSAPADTQHDSERMQTDDAVQALDSNPYG